MKSAVSLKTSLKRINKCHKVLCMSGGRSCLGTVKKRISTTKSNTISGEIFQSVPLTPHGERGAGVDGSLRVRGVAGVRPRVLQNDRLNL